jgi:hypothetical protein
MEETHLETEDPYVQWNGPPGKKNDPMFAKG